MVKKGDREVGILKKGDCFGEMGYLTRTRRTATIQASDNVSLMKVNSTLIEQVSTDCRLRFSDVFLRTLIERLSITTEMVVKSS